MRGSRHHWLFPILLLAVGTPGAAARDETAAPPAPTLSDVFEHVREDEIMPALAVLEQVVEADPSSRATAAQYWAMSGDVATANALFAQGMGPLNGAGPLPDLSQSRPEPALEAILREARGKRVVMINEAHHSPRHRAFTHKLVLALRAEGFTHLAAEAFCNGCEPLLEDGAPTSYTGFYTQEPVFADLVRQAAAAGYGLVAYEARPDQMAPPAAAWEERVSVRDLAQAENLKAALNADSAMRVVVHVGFGHLNEAGGPPAMFAAQLRRLTGEDPLTIDQVEGTRYASAEFDSPLRQAFVAAFGEPAVPMALDNDPREPLGGFYTVDLSVIHPPRREVGGRPDWLAMDGYRKPREVELAPFGERTLVRAFVFDEPEDAIAMDQIVIGPDAGRAVLMLPTGRYRLVRQTEAGDSLPLGEISVR